MGQRELPSDHEVGKLARPTHCAQEFPSLCHIRHQYLVFRLVEAKGVVE